MFCVDVESRERSGHAAIEDRITVDQTVADAIRPVGESLLVRANGADQENLKNSGF